MARPVASLFDGHMTKTETTRYLDVGASQLAYELRGSGPEALFLHGWPLHRATWRRMAEHLPASTCVLLDFPGSGESITPVDTPVSLRNHVDATVEFIKQRGNDGIVLVGHDSGGLIARMVAARLPGQVVGLVLIGTEIPGHHPKLIDQLQTMVKAPGAAAVTRRLLGSPRIARHKRMLGGLFWDRDLLEGSFRTQVLAPTLADPVSMDRQLELLMSYDHDLVDELEQIHADINCPTLLIWGEQDPFFPPALARSMAQQFGGPTRFELVADARLLVHEEHPERVAQLTREFLADIERGSR